ncbi:MAG: hypothetical protein MZW92_61535 [Comamonadaceae bacterium]|nr:hypothetical protein [Comamonadaceae bacterium]
MLNTVSDAITVIDRDLKVLFQNEAVQKLYGVKVGETCYEAYRGRREPCENCLRYRQIASITLGEHCLGEISKNCLIARGEGSPLCRQRDGTRRGLPPGDPTASGPSVLLDSRFAPVIS